MTFTVDQLLDAIRGADSLEELKSDIYFNVHDRYNWKDNIESSEKTEQK